MAPAKGRFVRIELPGAIRKIMLAEVQAAEEQGETTELMKKTETQDMNPAFDPLVGPEPQREAELKSRWVEELVSAHPLPEYPRPTMVREQWLNLNGAWEFHDGGPKPPKLPKTFPKKALVPSSTMAETCCLEEVFDCGWYRKSITIPQEWEGKKILLHCEAIGTKSWFYFDGKELGNHVGGFKRVSHELPGCTAGKTHEIIIYFDDTDPRMPRGKPGALGGIWQSVWLEPMENEYITCYKQTPDIDASSLVLSVESSDPSLAVTATALDKGEPVAEAKGQIGTEFLLEIPEQKLWSPEDPFLYDLVLELKKDGKTVDRVKGYFGMRKISTGEVEGEPRIFLNNEVYYQIGLLDQGTWPDSYYTQPSDKCLQFEIQTAKDMGFNVIRKHFKVESERWYTWCDRIGMLVWQDAPRQLHYVNSLHDYDEEGRELQRDMVREMITRLYNHTSIVMWVLFNEGGSQFDPRGMTTLSRRLDTSRLINATSHVNENQVALGRTRFNVDIFDNHCYARILGLKDYDCHIPAVLGEFGGIGYEIKGHTVERELKPWGYGAMVFSADELLAEYEKLVWQAAAMRKTDNLCAVIYTELTDFHSEVNGFITWDRNVVKVDVKQMQKINELFTKGKRT